MSKFIQGIFSPINKHKLIGNNECIYRSSYELKFFRWADTNPNILLWGSENVIIPYINPLDNRVHRYFVDNFIVFNDKAGKKRKFLIEIKPNSQIQKPVENKRRKKSTVLYEQYTWIKNQAKWEAARQWAKKKGCEFIILSEVELGI